MFYGSMVALVTPMTADGAIDYVALEKLIEFHIEAGTDVIVSVGTTGESATLTHDEHARVIRFTVQKVAGRIPVIGGTGANSTHEAIELTTEAKAAGVDGCLLVSPYYNKPTQEGLYLHHKAIAEAVAIPQLLYNVPGRTAVDMQPETVIRLSNIDNIVGVKEATGNLERISVIREAVGPEFLIISGDDATAREAILLGADGDISVTANVAPKLMHQMCAAARAGDAELAASIDEKLSGLHDMLFLESNPIPVKWALQEMGLMPVGIRLPLTPFADRYHDDLRAAMRQAGVI